jgi:branched-chain amino acid transport system ATP-binding protein
MAEQLVIDGLSAGYGASPVVHDVSFNLRPGELVALLGPNGAGKTTTLLAVSGLVPTFGGSIRVDGTSIEGTPSYRRPATGVVHVPEDRSLFFDLTVDENLALAASSWTKRKAYDVFPELRELKKRRAGLLSGGEQQMLAIGRALEMNPRYLMIDEMSLGLAPVIVRRVLDRIREIVSSANVSVLLVEQNVDLALEFADRVYLLVNGQIRYEGSRENALENWPSIRDAYFS